MTRAGGARGYDLAIRGGRLALPGVAAPVEADLAIRDGRIAGIGEGLARQAAEVVEVRGLWVLPGLIDIHVHFRDPGMVHKDTFLDGTRAAAFGGVTTVCDMPNTRPPVISAGAFEDKLRSVAGAALVDFGLWVGGRRYEEYGKLRDLGAVGLKIYLTTSETKTAAYFSDLFIDDDGELLDAMTAARDAGLFVSIHVDDYAVSKRRREAIRRAGGHGPRHYWEALHSVAPVLGTLKAIEIARALGSQVHIAHFNLTSVACLDAVRRARHEGVRVTAEAVPPVLNLEDLDRLGPYALPWAMADEENRAYWEAIVDGTLDVIATDHAPHTREEKEAGWRSIWDAPTGFPAVETTLPLMLTELAAGRITLPRLLEACCSGPADLLALPGKGHLALGYDADVVLVDPARRYRLSSEALHYKVGWTPHEGRPVQGALVSTFVRGQAVVRDGTLVGAPGVGRFVAPARGLAEGPGAGRPQEGR